MGPSHYKWPEINGLSWGLFHPTYRSYATQLELVFWVQLSMSFLCFFFPGSSWHLRWATEKKNGYFQLNPGCLMTGSLFHGLVYSPHKWVVSSFVYPKEPVFFFIAQVAVPVNFKSFNAPILSNKRNSNHWNSYTLEVQVDYFLKGLFSWKTALF